MARLIPSRFPHETEPSRRAEREFFEACRSTLSDEWLVVYSQNYVGKRSSLGQRHAPGEADFVLLHKTHGVLVVEVKGGNIDIREGSWISIDARDQEHQIKNPYLQAEEAARAIHDSVRRSLDDIRATRTVNHCVAFPAVSKSYIRSISTYGHAELTIFREDLAALSNKVQEAVRYWKQGTRWSDSDFAKVKQILVPTLKTPGISHLEYVHILRELDDLTESQKRTLRQLTHTSGKLVITGGAGTGKTVLGMYRAQQLASDGKKVVYLCANPNLARHLRDDVESNNPTLLSTLTIDAASQFISETARNGDRGEAFEKRKAKFPARSDRFLDAISSDNQAGSVDCLILDEAQDIRKEDLELLELLVRPYADGGSVLIFGDPNQQLHLKRAESALGSTPGVAPLTLDVNCRNTYEIAKVAHSFTKQSVDTLETRSGVQIRTVKCAGSLRELVKAEVLAVRSQFDPHSLAVLTLNGLGDIDEGDEFFVDGRRRDDHSHSRIEDEVDRIPVYSARTFQGREADAIVAAISARSLLKTYPFKDFARDVQRSAQVASRTSAIDDLRRVEGQYLRYKQHVTQQLVPAFRESLTIDDKHLSERRIDFLTDEFERTRLLEFEPEFRDAHLDRAWSAQQRLSLMVALYSMMTRARVILSIVSNQNAKKFIEEQIALSSTEASVFIDEVAG
jgi:hypothetical protein